MESKLKNKIKGLGEKREKKPLKHKKMWIGICIAAGIILAVVIADIIYAHFNKIPDEMYGTWYEYKESLTAEEFKKGDFQVSRLKINKDGTIAYYLNTEKGDKATDYFTDAEEHSLSGFSRLLIPYGLYTFNFPSFRIHRLSDYSIDDNRLTVKIDGKKHIFYRSSADVTSCYMKKFYDMESVSEYFIDYMEGLAIEQVSYEQFMKDMKNTGNAYIMFSDYVDYLTLEKSKADLEDYIKTSGRKWYYIDGGKLSDTDKELVRGTEISSYLNEDLYGIYSENLKEPVIVLPDGGNNPDTYGILNGIKDLKESEE